MGLLPLTIQLSGSLGVSLLLLAVSSWLSFFLACPHLRLHLSIFVFVLWKAVEAPVGKYSRDLPRIGVLFIRLM